MALTLPSQRTRIALLLAAITALSANAAKAQSVPAALAAPPKTKSAVAGAASVAPIGWDAMNAQDLAMMADFIIQSSAEHGLYLTANEMKQIDQIRMMSPESARSMLVPMFMSMARQLHGGRLVPTEVGQDIRFSKKSLKEEVLRKMVLESQGSREKMGALLAPKMIDYKMLVKMHARLQEQLAAQALQPLAPIPAFKKPLKLGVSSPALPAIKARLAAMGFPMSSMDEKFDDATDLAIGDVQRQMKFNPDKIISPNGATLRYLSTPIEARIAQVRADMEKMRWLPQDPGQRYIFVNLAFSSLLLMDYSHQNPVVFNFRTINGRAERKTPSMVDKIYQVILNPFWTVPPTVFIKDKVETIKKLSYWEIDSYFAQNHFTIVSENFRQRYSPSSIDWQNITSSKVGFYIRQQPNYYNALGVVKFSLTNGEAIYLHDTGERELFAEENRLRSSGCVRVEKPIDLAEYVLAGTKWDRWQIENSVVRPGEVLEKDTPIEVKNAIPVYMVPVTSHLGSDNIMRFTDDVYGHNAAIKEMTTHSLY